MDDRPGGMTENRTDLPPTKEKQEKALALLLRLGGHFRPQCGRFPGTGADAFPDRQTCD